MMKATYRLERVDHIDATLTVTMPIGEWRQIMRQLPQDWPSWKFASRIADMIGKAAVHFDATDETER